MWRSAHSSCLFEKILLLSWDLFKKLLLLHSHLYCLKTLKCFNSHTQCIEHKQKRIKIQGEMMQNLIPQNLHFMLNMYCIVVGMRYAYRITHPDYNTVHIQHEMKIQYTTIYTLSNINTLSNIS